MIPDKYIDAYKSIKAPETLHDRVTASAASTARRTRILPRLLTAAASLGIVTAAVIALRTGGVGTNAYIAYNGQPVDASVAISMSETSDIKFFGIGMSAPRGIRLEVHITDTTNVTVSDGSVTLVDENGTPTDTGDTLTLSGNTDPGIVYWQADFYKVINGVPFSLTLSDAHGSVTYTLTDSGGELTLTKDIKN